MTARRGAHLPTGSTAKLAPLSLLLLMACLPGCCRQLGDNSTDRPVSGCVPREIPASAASAWVGAPPPDDASGTVTAGGQQQQRRRRGLLVSDTECSLENLCDPSARPRVCYYNADICDGEQDCSSGRDELFCDECLCPYERVDGVTASVPDSAVRYWIGVNLKGCARACNDIESGCVGFSFNALNEGEHRCRIFFQPGSFVASNIGGSLYIRNEPSTPRLGRGGADALQMAPPAVDCSRSDVRPCPSGNGQCVPYSQLCDGVQQCSGNSEEFGCPLYLKIYSRLDGKTIGSYSSPLPAVSRDTCAAYCLYHSTEHPKCLFFAYRSSNRQCLIGCSSCGDSPQVIDETGSEFYSVHVAGTAALAAAIVDFGASPSNRDAANFESLRPTVHQLTESLKTLGISIPDLRSSDAVSTLLNPTRTAVPSASTIGPGSVPRPPPRRKPPGNQPNSGQAQDQFFGRPPTLATPNNSPAAPSSSFSGSVTPAAAPTATPQLPAQSSQLFADCGRRPLDPLSARTQLRVIPAGRTSNRVVGGEPATYGTYPWQAQIELYSDAGHFEHHCGGALISERLVLTAAHCLEPARTRLQVKLGQHDRRDASEQFEQTFAVENMLSHPGYRSDSASGASDDIGVMKLRLRFGRPVVFSSHVQPLCLPSGPPTVGQECHVSGWGKTDAGLPDSPRSAADVLHGVVVPVISDTLCAARELYGARFAAGRMLCAGHLAGGADSCQGDSGGPLVCPGGDGRWQLAGIVSFGEGCGAALKPGVYTRVDHYVPWIRAVAQSLGK
ncbi:uncharacterized protein LOC122389858 [Amphibalanus amphitrite]|uniref:uncharacterized protein LOC122389858 n=1 Tax=Amphibalanus amphitrite TaxID=1232801 RepID=UPI001C90364C|nr:uncharacterized protein LOC122389858 [Amphibalanus amphitrite]